MKIWADINIQINIAVLANNRYNNIVYFSAILKTLENKRPETNDKMKSNFH